MARRSSSPLRAGAVSIEHGRGRRRVLRGVDRRPSRDAGGGSRGHRRFRGVGSAGGATSPSGAPSASRRRGGRRGMRVSSRLDRADSVSSTAGREPGGGASAESLGRRHPVGRGCLSDSARLPGSAARKRARPLRRISVSAENFNSRGQGYVGAIVLLLAGDLGATPRARISARPRASAPSASRSPGGCLRSSRSSLAFHSCRWALGSTGRSSSFSSPPRPRARLCLEATSLPRGWLGRARPGGLRSSCRRDSADRSFGARHPFWPRARARSRVFAREED